jgi:saccharopine dehydrogenase-like NADP-dependent oxidoreductase
MSRTTAFPAAAVARLLARGGFPHPGVHPPEVLGAEDGPLDDVLAALRARGVQVRGGAVPPGEGKARSRREEPQALRK